MPSRSIEDLAPEMQTLSAEFAVAMHDRGIPFLITSTYRSQAEQDKLYAQGRTTAGKKVTWTKHSRHSRRTAFDIVIVGKDGRARWDVKADINEDQIPDYVQAGEIGESLGLEWGGRWSTPDYPHFQLKEG